MLWQLKILVKLILSRLPFGYWFWHRLGVFRHGRMHDPAYSIQVASRHLDRFERIGSLDGAVILELGPGTSLASAIIAKAHGCARCYLVDAGDFATRDVKIYRRHADALSARGLPVPDLSAVADTNAMLKRLDATYMTDGLRSLQAIPDESVDFIWSHAVLEHVRLHEVDAVFAEFRRILTPAGIMSHCIDFKDHLAASLNNLRFSHRVWESEFMARSGFYTNRIRYSAMLDALRRAGFSVEIKDISRWEDLPIPRARMDRSFRNLPEVDLLISGCDLVARPLERPHPQGQVSVC